MSSLQKNTEEAIKNILIQILNLVLIQLEKHITEKIFNGKELLKSYLKLNL